MAGRLADRIALITGGGSGIGRACALRFAQEGARVCVADLDAKGAAETARQVEAQGQGAVAVQVDTTDEAATTAMVERCVTAFGGVDVLIAAAGVGSPRRAGAEATQPHTVLTIPLAQFRSVIDVNLYGVLLSNQAVARWMVAHQRRGAIVNLASIMSRMPSTGAAYSVSKAGVWMLHQVPGPGAGAARDPRQRHRARLHRDAHDGAAARGREADPLGHGHHPHGAFWHTGGGRGHRALPGLGRGVVLHRRAVAPLGRRVRRVGRTRRARGARHADHATSP
jgi:NADP-dependent 3-hydroxy acid dehydrogenase YdfG